MDTDLEIPIVKYNKNSEAEAEGLQVQDQLAWTTHQDLISVDLII